MESINLQVLDTSHVSGLVTLYAEIFGKNVDADFFIHKYGLQLKDAKQFSVVGVDQGEVIGFFGALKQRFEVNGKEFQVAHACDYYIRKKYRGKGTFDQLYFEMLRRANETGMQYLYAYTSEQTAKFSIKHEWEEASTFLRIDKQVFPKPIKSVLERTLGSAWSAKELSKRLRPHKIELHSELLSEDQNSGQIYDDDFIKMKQYCSRFFVEIEGCRMWLKYDYRLTIGWLQLTKKADLKKSLKTLTAIARKSGVHQIVLHVQPFQVPKLKLNNSFNLEGSFRVFYKQLDASAPNFTALKPVFIDGDLF